MRVLICISLASLVNGYRGLKIAGSATRSGSSLGEQIPVPGHTRNRKPRLTRLDEFRQAATPLDPFLYASIGEDRGGSTVTVLSALARLGLDPWEAANDLSRLSRDEARARLDGFLVRSGDVPALAQRHGEMALRLIALLPKAVARPMAQGVRSGAPGIMAPIVPILVVLALIAVLVQVMLPGLDGSGN